MSAMEICGLLLLSYATSIAVWELCDRDTAAALKALAVDDERPSAIPRLRCGGDGDAA